MATLLNPSGTRSGAPLIERADSLTSQVVFIDSTVQDVAVLLSGLAPGVQVYVLDPAEDGLTQIAQVLSGRTGITAISIIAHGEEGEIRLGAGIVDQAVVSQAHAALATIGSALAPGGDILLYGCDTGAGTDGQALVDQIAAATGANVAASSHLVGDVADGDGWNLDVTSTGKALVVPQVLSAASEDSYASPLAINDPPAGLPISITSFTGNTSFATTGNTTINSNGYLQLTSAATYQTGLAVYSQKFPASTGISVQFTYYSGGGTGADGFSFFLLNADAITAAGGSASTVAAGGYGGGLGYSNDGQAGITDGFLGLGFDTYGNYTAVDRGQSGNAAKTPNEIAVRGAGNGTTGYALLTGTPYAAGIDGTRTVRINLLKIDSTHESLSVFMSSNGGQTYTEVITNEVVNQTLPNDFYLGFAAGTGRLTEVHAIENLSVTLPVTLAVSTPTIAYPNSADAASLTLLPGDRFSYSFTITDTGPNGSSEITLLDTAPSVETGVTWSVKDDVRTQTGTGNINLSNIDLSSGDSATVTVSGTISATATTGNASHAIITTPGVAFSYLTPATGMVPMAIGTANPQLAGVFATTTTPNNTPLPVFYSAQIADAHTTPAMTATITLSNSAGTVGDGNGVLSGTGLTESATPGIYSLSATGTSAFNADLEALVFTPTLSSQSVVTTIGISVTDGFAGTTAATATTMVTATPTCFLAGTRILTERGEVPVEELFERHCHGMPERAAVLEEGRIVFQEIVWVGGRHLDAHAVVESGAYPVRIARHAFAEDVPSRDLLVTPEHCVFTDGRLIPARMLVNGRTITEDRSIGSYSYYHVELASHGVLISEGLTTESYLDTGNRGSFANSGVVTLRPHRAAPAARRGEPCAPLAVARAEAEAIWRGLDQRADQLGVAPRPVAVTENDPALTLLLDDGSVVQPRWQDGQRHFFQLPAGRHAVRLRSRAAVPAQSVGAYVDDRRRLGVQLEALVLWQGLAERRIPAERLQGDGWHGLEGAARWTDGDAALDLPAMDGADGFLELIVTGSLPYLADRVLLAA